jgi:signal transduction histidine kinase/ActR/RegA family two-component response regulator
MPPESQYNPDERILILAPTGRDAALMTEIFRRDRIEAVPVRTVEQLCLQMDRGAGAVILAEEGLSDAAVACLNGALERQPAWSELPIILLTTGGMTTRKSTRVATRFEPRANVTLIERPVRILTLLSTVHAALRARRRQLEVRDLLDDKDAAFRKQSEGVRRRDEFLAMLGHELRNPLATVRNALELLDDPAVAGEQRAIIERQARHLARLVDDLLDVSRVTTGKIMLNRSPVDLAALVRRAVDIARPVCAGQAQSLTFDRPPEPMIVNGDPVRLEQVVTNLVHNACKYTPSSGRVHVSVAVEDGQAVVRVRDNGIGISAEMLPHVFDLFTQADTSLHRTHGGLGIGLTVVKSLVEMHGGSVSVESPGQHKGSTFTVRLPLRADLHVTDEVVPTVHAVRRRVLVVEDNPDALTVMTRLVRKWGHDVVAAEDGPNGVEAALRMRPEIVLLDVGLPGMDGYEVARRLRQELNGSAVLVALTGYGQPEDRRRAHAAGFDVHLVKPVSPPVLARLLAEARPGEPLQREQNAPQR